MAIAISGLVPLLEVFDLPASIAFYPPTFWGLHWYRGDESWWCLLKLDGATLMLNTAYEDNERPTVPEPTRVRGHASLYFLIARPG